MPRAPLCTLSLLLPSLYPILLPPRAAVGAASQPRAPGLAGRLGAGWPAAGDPRVTFASPPCQFTELPFPINVTAGESRRIIDGEGGGSSGGRGPRSLREGEADQPACSGYLRRLARSFAVRGTSGNLCFSDNLDECARRLKIAWKHHATAQLNATRRTG